MRLMLVEDNTRLAGFIAKGLRSSGFTVDLLETGRDAETALANESYDAVILDLGLPDMDGLSLVKSIRARGNGVPILILTARDGLGDRVLGLDTGADDYMVKPFAIEEMIARVRALTRRPRQALDKCLRFGNVALDTTNREVEIGGARITLARREIDLLELLLRRAGHVVPRPVLESQMYGHDDEMTPNSFEVAVSRLRKSLRQADASVFITTFRNVGYMLSKTEL
jgi:DNA-binding response OmpR family regulator